MPTPRPAFSIALASAALLSLAGCSGVSHTEGGSQNSTDSFTYVSTTYQPKTVTLVDTRDGEEVWSMDVPVGEKLTIAFYADRAKKSTPENPDVMRWGLGKATRKNVSLREKQTVPPAGARRIDMSLRATPEWPQAKADE